jgi:hypothetical protein
VAFHARRDPEREPEAIRAAHARIPAEFRESPLSVHLHPALAVGRGSRGPALVLITGSSVAA